MHVKIGKGTSSLVPQARHDRHTFRRFISRFALQARERGIAFSKHPATYLDEMTWRINNRKNPFLFRNTMLNLIASENLEYKELVKAA
jgi:hypothetical protein